MNSLPPGVRRVLRLGLTRPPVEEEIESEVAFHLEMRAAEMVARGWTPEAARAEARRRFGDTHQWSVAMTAVDRDRTARERRVEWWHDLRQDLRYGVRSLLRTPLFTLLAVVTLALGIGANAAVFGVTKSVLLDALPYTDPGRLLRIYTQLLDGSMDRAPISAAMISDIAERQRSFSHVAAFEAMPREAILEGQGEPSVVNIVFAEPTLFTTLGVGATLGRVLTAEDAATDTAFQIVLTHAAWQRQFGGDPAIVGQTVRINGISRTVVGVLPRDFVGPVRDVDAYFPLALRGALRDPVRARRQQNYAMVARLAPGITAEAAEREVASIGAELAREHPQYHGHIAVWAPLLRDDMAGETRTPLLVLMASAGLVLVITCANLAGALLSRTLSRRKEFAVRMAIGAGRWRLVRQLLTESAVLALAGGAAGILLASVGLGILRGLALPALPDYAELALDPAAMLVTGLVAVATGLAFGVVPALSAGRSDVQGTLREETRGSSESRRTRHLRGVLVAGQIALCVSLLVGAGLLARSLWAIAARPLGFNPEGMLAVSVQLPLAGYPTGEARVRFIEQYEERLRALPGVTAVSAAGAMPTGVSGRTSFVVDDAETPAGDAPAAVLVTEVSDQYFRTVGTPLIEGRVFEPDDGTNRPLRLVISESLARIYWPNSSAVGRVIRMSNDPDAPRAEVVGVVGDVRNDPAQPEPEPMMYMSVRQAPWNGPVFLLRTRGEPLELVRPARAELASVDPTLPLHNPVTLRARLAEGLAGRRLPVVLMTAFGALALLLASVGVYAMFAAMVAAREREFGVRVALGASRRAIAELVLRQGGIWMGVGLAGGALGAALVARLVRGLLYGVAPSEPLALVFAVGTLLVCAAVALLVPLRRATGVDPINVLR